MPVLAVSNPAFGLRHESSVSWLALSGPPQAVGEFLRSPLWLSVGHEGQNGIPLKGNGHTEGLQLQGLNKNPGLAPSQLLTLVDTN